MNCFTISQFHHSVGVSFHHFIISVSLSYTISLNNLSHHITHHLYKYYILIDHLTYYSDSDERCVNRSSHEYAKASRKYETYLHITSASLDNLPNLNSSRPNIFTKPEMFKKFGGCEATISENYCAPGRFFVYALNHSYIVCFYQKTRAAPVLHAVYF